MSQMKGALGQLMRQAQQVQEKVQQAQAEAALLEVTGESGAGMVKVLLTGQRQAKSVKIDPAALEEDVDFLEDLIAAAINDAEQKLEAAIKDKMQSATGGLNLPPGMNLPF